MKRCVFCFRSLPLGRDSTGKGPNNDAMNVFPLPRFPRSIDIDTPAPRPRVMQNYSVYSRACQTRPFSFYTHSSRSDLSLPPPSTTTTTTFNTSRFVYPATHPRFRLIGHGRVTERGNATVPSTLTVNATWYRAAARRVEREI